MYMDEKRLQAYRLLKEETIPDIRSEGYLLEHKKTGARICVLENPAISQLGMICHSRSQICRCSAKTVSSDKKHPGLFIQIFMSIRISLHCLPNFCLKVRYIVIGFII